MLTVDYAEDKEAFAAEKKEDSNKTYYFANAEFTVNGSKGDFLKNLKSVTLLLTRKMRLREISTRKACPAATMFTMKYPGMARS
mgnify:CR=1 FL=1